MIKIVIVEDEDAAVERLTEMLLKSSFEIQIIKVLDSVIDSIEYFSESDDYDIILMDIHLSDGNSFDIFHHITIIKPIIFTTAYSEFALEAFKQYAVDYLLKPIKSEQLEMALTKYSQLYLPTLPDYTNLNPEKGIVKRWVIKNGQNIRVIAHADVAFYFTQEKITYLMTFEGKKYAVEMPLEQIERQIIDTDYFRINRQYIIHRLSINTMSTHTKSRVRIMLRPSVEEVIVSTERSPQFKKWLKS